MKKSAIGCIFGWLIALLFCLSAHAQTVENCIDDDGRHNALHLHLVERRNYPGPGQPVGGVVFGRCAGSQQLQCHQPDGPAINPPPSLCPPLAVTRR